ncbi:MAG: response regulator [Lachnospiraceae bacterium]|nr:response regulator [Lachnospiraceae bacterium]
MKSIQTRIILMISGIMIVMAVIFLITSIVRTNAILNDDSDQILLSSADYYADVINDSFNSTEQSVGTIYDYAIKRTESYKDFLEDEEQRDAYTNDISELGKSIAENTTGAMAVYLRYNPDDYGASNGFWYTINLSDGSWQSSVPTDMSLYDKDDIEHVGWYYIPVEAGLPMWMDPYFNKNLGVEMISYIMPFYYGNYTVGIIGMDIDIDKLRESVSQIRVYESGRAFLLSKGGDFIYHEDFPDGMSQDDMTEEDLEYFKEIRGKDIDSVYLYTARDGTQKKLIKKKLKNGMTLGLYVPISEIEAPQKGLMRQLLLISCGILFIAIIACLIIVRTIISPLRHMTEVAENYANGEFDEDIAVKGNDEVSVLSRSLQTMAKSLTQQIEIADNANKAKSGFLANMSHEIRTPINAVLGMNEMILREAKDENILEYSSDIQSAGRTLLSLINSILDFSKIEDGKMEIMPVSYDVASLVNNLVNSISERAKAKGLELYADIDENLPCVLKGDDVRLTQVIMNLLTNAVKYTEKGRVTLSFKGGERNENGIELVVSVKDTGVGIREGDIDKLFESFTRIDEKKNRNIEGTGLGMAIVTKLLIMMDSELKIDSTFGKGSVFSFSLHQEIVDPQPIGNYVKRVRDSYRRGDVGQYPQMSGAKVLVVDDYDMNLKVCRNLLKIYGVEPDLVSSGREAIEAIRNNSYHIVFLDHMMPQMDGIETLKELREQRLTRPSMFFIALTANAVVGAKDTYLEAGFDDYLSKPIDVEALGEILYNYLPGELISFENEDETAEVVEETIVNDGETFVMEFTPGKKGETKKEDTADRGEDKTARFHKALKEAGVDAEEGLRHCAGDESFYEELLADYALTCTNKCIELISRKDNKDWNEYRILIHALKGASRTIGAAELSERAKALEDASRDEDETFIESHHEDFIVHYKVTVSEIDSALAELN